MSYVRIPALQPVHLMVTVPIGSGSVTAGGSPVHRGWPSHLQADRSYILFLENPSLFNEFNYIMVNPEEYNGAWQLRVREIVGTDRIVAQDCNSLVLEYDLEAIGLGAGTEILQRIFSLEIQGYACRDILSRIDRLND